MSVPKKLIETQLTKRLANSICIGIWLLGLAALIHAIAPHGLI